MAPQSGRGKRLAFSDCPGGTPEKARVNRSATGSLWQQKRYALVFGVEREGKRGIKVKDVFWDKRGVLGGGESATGLCVLDLNY